MRIMSHQIYSNSKDVGAVYKKKNETQFLELKGAIVAAKISPELFKSIFDRKKKE